jgi:hypothetical protein
MDPQNRVRILQVHFTKLRQGSLKRKNLDIKIDEQLVLAVICKNHQFPGKEGGIQVLAGLAPSSQRLVYQRI